MDRVSSPPFFDGEQTIAELLGAYLSLQGEALTVGRLRRFPAGFSWLTYEASLIGSKLPAMHSVILRIGSPHGSMAPYVAQPEYLALRAVEDSVVPAPRALWYSDDPSILGAPFLIQEKREGHTSLSWEMSARPPAERERLAAQFIDILAALHNVDWRRTPMAALGNEVTPANATLRQIDLWEERAHRWSVHPVPIVGRAFQWLRARLPQSQRIAIVHGDYRVGNFLEQESRISAILDWEFAHIGDPLEDLGWAFLRDFAGGKDHLVGGLASRDSMLERYRAHTGLDVTTAALEYHEIFAKLRLAIVYMASHYRFEVAKVNDIRMANLALQLPVMFRQLGRMIEAVQ
jgi:aminoglycoside phosphotransferase (APT) family kinase protein